MPESKIRKLFVSRIFIFLMLLAVIWTGIILIKTIYKKDQLQGEIDNLKNEIEKIDKNNGELANLIGYFSSNNFLEKEAKEKLNLKKEGENVVMVPEAVIGQSIGQNIETKQDGIFENRKAQISENNFIKWWKYFFGR